MRMLHLGILLILLSMQFTAFGQTSYVMVVHGGAGTILKKNMSPQREAAFRETLSQALKAGFAQLQAGKSSVEAVETTIMMLEDSPLFNAGKGAVFTHEGRNELDASIMSGATGEAGSVAGVTTIRNPIQAARLVMEQSAHVMLAQEGAEAFALSEGLQTVDPTYFWTERRWNALQRILKRDSIKNHEGNQQSTKVGFHNDEKFGTVGAVALDRDGHLAAGTSTGGMTNKRYGRIGDSPIIGAGTFANDRVGVSCTGWGEFFIKNVAAYDVAAQMEYAHLSVAESATSVIGKIGKAGGDGGIIALDADGNIAMPFNTDGMFRGSITESGKIEIAMYK